MDGCQVFARRVQDLDTNQIIAAVERWRRNAYWRTPKTKRLANTSRFSSKKDVRKPGLQITSFIRRVALPDYYEIKVNGHLDPRWSDWFMGLKLTQLEGDETLLSGSLPDQAALHGLLERIRDLNLTLLSVTRGGSSIQDSDKK